MVVSFVNGTCQTKSPAYECQAAAVVYQLEQVWRVLNVAPRRPHDQWFQHIFREYNTKADALATQAIQDARSSGSSKQFIPHSKGLRGYFDGGRRGCMAGAGWLIEASWHSNASGEIEWQQVAFASLQLGDVTVMQAEMFGAQGVVKGCISILAQGEVIFDQDVRVTWK